MLRAHYAWITDPAWSDLLCRARRVVHVHAWSDLLRRARRDVAHEPSLERPVMQGSAGEANIHAWSDLLCRARRDIDVCLERPGWQGLVKHRP